MADIHKILSNSGPYVAKDGSLGIGTDSPATGYQLTLSDSSTAGLALNDTGQSGNYQIAANAALSYWRYDGDNSKSIVLTGTGLVGIGTTSPTTKLEILGATGNDAIRINYGQSADIFLGFSSTNPRILLQDNTNTNTHHFVSNGDNYIVGSNLGLGTTSPSAKLEISHTDTMIRMSDSDGTNQYLELGHNNGSSTYVSRNGGSEGHHVFYTSGGSAVERMRILAGGYVAIGQSTAYAPTGGGSTMLTVTRTANEETNLVVSNQANNAAAEARLIMATYGHDFIISGTSSLGGSKLMFYRAGTELLRFGGANASNNDATFAGKIKTTSTGSATIAAIQLRPQVDGDGLGISAPATDQMNFITADNTRMVIKSDGKVGIGTDSPGSYNSRGRNLVVAGSGDVGITIDGASTGSGTLLFADGTGGTAGYRGIIEYDHADNSMTFSTAATETLRLNSDQSATFAGTVNIAAGTTGSVGGGHAGIVMTNRFDNPDNSFSIKPQISGVSNTGLEIRDETDNASRLVIDGSGKVGIANTSPDSTLHVGSAAANSLIKVQGSGTAGIQVFTGTDKIASLEQYFSNEGTLFLTLAGTNKVNLRANGNSYFNGGNVGIGTASPLGKLHVYNTSETSDRDGTATETASGQDSILLYGHGGFDTRTYGGITWMGGTSRRRAMITAVAENNDSDFVGLAFYTQGTDGSGDFAESLRISHSGKVGIGTIAGIDNKLHVEEKTGNTACYTTIQAASWDAGVQLKNGNGSWEILNDYTGLGTTGSLAFYGHSAYRMVINNSGNVGIGTTSPSELLTLNKASGAVGILLEGNGTDVGKFKVASAGVNHAIQFGTISNNEIQFHTNNVEAMRIAANGEVGIGMNNPWTNLVVAGSGSTTGIGSDASYRLCLTNTNQTNNNWSMISFNDGATEGGSAAMGCQYLDHTNNYGSLVFATRDSGGFAERVRINSSGSVSFTQSIYLPDSKSAYFGTGSDFSINHDGNNTGLVNNTGHLYISNYADNKDIVFQNDDGSGGVTEYYKVDGLNENIKFSVPTVHIDNSSAYFGTDGDLQIKHDGASSSFINNFTGHLYLRNYADNSDIYFQSDDGSGGLTNYFYMDGSLADGTNVGTRFPDDSIILLGSGSGFQDGAQIYHNGSHTIFNNYVGALYFNELTDDGNIIFSTDNGSGGLTEYFRLDGGDGRMYASREIRFVDGVASKYGNSGDLGIYHDGSNSYIEEGGVGGLRIKSSAMSFSTDDTYLTNYSFTFRDAVGINNPNDTSAATSSTTVMAIGAKSGGTIATSLITTGAVGIGTASPSQKLEVIGTTRITGDLQLDQQNPRIDFDNGVANGSLRFYSTAKSATVVTINPAGALTVTSDGARADGSTLLLKHANNNTTDTIGTIFFGSNADETLSKIVAETSGANNTSNLVFGTSSTGTMASRMILEADGDLHVDGDVIAYSTTTSDIRLKDNVLTLENSLDKISKLRGVEYTWNATSRKGQKDIGVIAQEVEEVIPEIVREKKMALIEGGTYKTVDYERLTAVLIEAVKELKEEVEELKNKCNDCTK